MLRLHPGKSSYKEKSSVPGSSLLPGCCHPSTRPQPLFQDPFSRSEEHGIIAGEEMDRGQFRGEGGNRERKNSWNSVAAAVADHCCSEPLPSGYRALSSLGTH